MQRKSRVWSIGAPNGVNNSLFQAQIAVAGSLSTLLGPLAPFSPRSSAGLRPLVCVSPAFGRPARTYAHMCAASEDVVLTRWFGKRKLRDDVVVEAACVARTERSSLSGKGRKTTKSSVAVRSVKGNSTGCCDSYCDLPLGSTQDEKPRRGFRVL